MFALGTFMANRKIIPSEYVFMEPESINVKVGAFVGWQK
jgi:hypothetical protein